MATRNKKTYDACKGKQHKDGTVVPGCQNTDQALASAAESLNGITTACRQNLYNCHWLPSLEPEASAGSTGGADSSGSSSVSPAGASSSSESSGSGLPNSPIPPGTGSSSSNGSGNGSPSSSSNGTSTNSAGSQSATPQIIVTTTNPLKPYATVSQCPSGETPVVTNWPQPGDMTCHNNSPKIVVPNPNKNNPFQPYVTVSKCPSGETAVVTNLPKEGDLTCK